MNKLKEELNYFIYESHTSYFDLSQAEAKSILKELEKIDKAKEYNNHLIKDAKYHLNLGHLKKMDKILKGDSNE